MGLKDFFKKGEKEPAKNPNPVNRPAGQPAGGSIFPNQNAQQPAPAAPAAASQDTYTVQSGDSLSKIAKNHYGDANSWKKIYEANKTTIGNNPDLIKPGQRLTIPR